MSHASGHSIYIFKVADTVSRGPENLVPCSDMAGEVVAIGEDVKGWKPGDRVCANFASDHIYGDTNPAIQRTSLGGQAHGVLTQYRSFPAHVGFFLLCLQWKYLLMYSYQSLVAIPSHLSYEEASTLPYVVWLTNKN